MSERGGPVHSYTVRAHHHDGSGGSERAAPNRNTPLAWRVQGVARNEGNGQGKDHGSGSGALNHARARAGTGSARTAQKNQTRCMPDLREWVEHGQSHGGHTVTWDSPLTQARSVRPKTRCWWRVRSPQNEPEIGQKMCCGTHIHTDCPPGGAWRGLPWPSDCARSAPRKFLAKTAKSPKRRPQAPKAQNC